MAMIKLSMDTKTGDVIADIGHEVKVGYNRQFNTVSVIKGIQVLRTDSVPLGYKLSEFQDDVLKYRKIFKDSRN